MSTTVRAFSLALRLAAHRSAALCALLAALAAPLRADVPAGFTESPVLTGLTAPTALAFLPDGRLLVTEMDGTLLLADLGAEGSPPTTLAEIPVAFCNFDDYETGLLGIAVDPAFARNGFLYLYRTISTGDACEFLTAARVNQVVRVTFSEAGEGGSFVDLDSLVVLLDGIEAPYPYHCGGGLRIGPGDLLFVSTGDTWTGDEDEISGPGASTNPFAQDLTTLEGKLLRIALDGSIPADNPFVGAGGGVREEIFAYGFRNPWRFGIDEQTGAPWVGDVGQDTIEEIDVVVPGGNYGWPRCEGKLPKGCGEKGDSQPVFTYPHSGTGALGGGSGATVIGGAFAPGQFAYEGGTFYFADFVGSTIFSVRLNKPRNKFQGQPAVFATDALLPVDLVFGPDHALYYASIAGDVRRISPPPSGGTQPLFGSSLQLKGGTKPSLKLLAKDALVLGGGEDNPTLAGGSLRVLGTASSEGGGVLFDVTYPLPASGWKLTGKAPDKVKGFKYSDGKLLSGPISSVVVTSGKLVKVAGKGEPLLLDLASEPALVQLVLTLGTRSWCMAFDEASSFTADTLYKSTNQPAPSECP